MFKFLGPSLFASAATPAPLIETIRTASEKAQVDPGYRSRTELLNFDIPNETPAVFQANIVAEGARWAALVKATGFRAVDWAALSRVGKVAVRRAGSHR